MKTKRQAKQERTLQSAKNQYKQDKADLKSMHLWSDKKLTRHEKKGCMMLSRKQNGMADFPKQRKKPSPTKKCAGMESVS